MKIFSVLIVGLLICSTAMARTPKPTDGVLGFRAQLGIMKGLILSAQLDEQVNGGASKIRDEASRQKADLERMLKPALNGAKGKADLGKVIKGCYIAAQSYLDSADPYDNAGRALKNRLEADLGRCQNELDMEINLAGITM